MWRWVVAVGLALERFTHERRLVFVVVTLVALVPATMLYDQANRSTRGVRSLAANLGEKLLAPTARAASPESATQATADKDPPVADPRLVEIIARWPSLSPELRQAVLAVVQSSQSSATSSSDNSHADPPH